MKESSLHETYFNSNGNIGFNLELIDNYYLKTIHPSVQESTI